VSEIVRKIMTKHVVTIRHDKSGLEAAKLMSERNISSLIVENNQIPIGIVTERDFVKKICFRDLQASAVNITDIMSEIQIFAEPTTPIDVAVQRMLNHKIRRLPIIEDGRIVGIVTVTDLAKELRKIILIEGLLSEFCD
jgi:CBS domain-containing protein